MDISLEKIDIIRDRTGVSYKEAKDALEQADGNVVDALINIEEAGNKKWTETISIKGSEAVEKIKNIVKSGNVNRIRIKKEDYTILDIPVTAGALGAVVIPQITAIGTAVALMSKCTIEVERPNRETINVNNMIATTADDIANKIKNAAGELKNMKPGTAWQNAAGQNVTGQNTGIGDEIDQYGAPESTDYNFNTGSTFETTTNLSNLTDNNYK